MALINLEFRRQIEAMQSSVMQPMEGTPVVVGKTVISFTDLSRYESPTITPRAVRETIDTAEQIIHAIPDGGEELLHRTHNHDGH